MSKEYLSHALTLQMKGQRLEILLEIWHHFLQTQKLSYFDQTTMDLYVENILSSGNPIGDFVLPKHLALLGSDLAM